MEQDTNSTSYRLPLFSLVIIVISFVIGMGIFKLPASVAATSGVPAIFYAAWVVGGITALAGALVYAEIGKRLPAVGGYYKIFSECYHPAVGFTVNILILISNAASVAIVALIGADYVADLLYGESAGVGFNILVAVVAVGLFYVVNLLGLRTSSQTQNILMLIKIGLVLLLISTIFTGLTAVPHDYDSDAKLYVYDGSNALLLFLISLVSVSFAYGGYQQTINFGGESKSPSTLPLAILLGMALVLVLYLAVSYVYVQVIGFEAIKNATAIGALLCETWFGTAGAKFFDACMFLSVLAYVNIGLMSNPRVMYAMSKDGVLPTAFQKKTDDKGVFTVGLTVFAIVTVAVVFLGKGVDNILSFTMFLDSIGMATSAATLFILRRRQRETAPARGFMGKITPFLAAFFIFMYIVIAVAVVIKDPIAAAIGAGLLVIFVAVYWFSKRGAK